MCQVLIFFFDWSKIYNISIQKIYLYYFQLFIIFLIKKKNIKIGFLLNILYIHFERSLNVRMLLFLYSLTISMCLSVIFFLLILYITILSIYGILRVLKNNEFVDLVRSTRDVLIKYFFIIDWFKVM